MGAGREYPARPLVGIGVVLFRVTGGVPDAVLLIRRGRAPALGLWSFPGGAQKLGETAEAAARRELREETGLTAGPLTLADYADSIHLDQTGQVQFHYTILNFCGVATAGVLTAASDVTEAVWAPLDGAGFGLGDTLRLVLARARGTLGAASGDVAM